MTSTDYLSTKQVAEHYGLSASWITKLRVAGGGSPFLKVGRRVLYERRTFEDWLAKHSRTSTSEAA